MAVFYRNRMTTLLARLLRASYTAADEAYANKTAFSPARLAR
jgi:hypothetical protein